jgi:hypothetical protein
MRYLLVSVLLLACTPPKTGAPEMTQAETKTCLARWQIEASASVLNEQRGAGPPWEDFPRRYAAAAIAAGYSPVKTVERFRFQAQPLLWFTPDKRDAVLDTRFSSGLEAVDVPRLGPGERKVLGALRAEAARALAPREILEFLLRADLLRTYWHIGSELCLERESSADGGYRAELSGEHVYFTNEENHDPLAFAVEIGADGVVAVTGLPLRGRK